MKTKDFQYETNGKRVFLAFVAGAVIAALTIVVVPYAFSILDKEGWQYFLTYGADTSIFLLIYVGAICFVLIVVFGGPVWAMVHQKGWRTWWHACVFGGATAFVAMLIIQTNFFTGYSSSTTFYSAGGITIWRDGVLTDDGWWRALLGAVASAGVGVLVALVIWRVAYRKIRDV